MPDAPDTRERGDVAARGADISAGSPGFNSPLSAISVAIIARNAAGTIAKTLASVSAFGEVVLYLNESGDDTEAIAGRQPNVRIVRGAFKGFGPTKNAAIAEARNDWILSLDSDESLSPDLQDSVSNADLSNPSVAFVVRRENYFMGARIRHGDFGPEPKVRLFHRSVCRFDEAAVHESVAVPRTVEHRNLAGPLVHDWVNELGQLGEKLDLYTDLRGAQDGKAPHPTIIMARAGWAFCRCYLLRMGFLDGWRGLVIAVWTAENVFYKYMKVFTRIRLDHEAE